MKKRIFAVFTALYLLIFPLSAGAENNVSEISISVSIFNDGSACITQVWDGTFTEGTENYIPINTDGISVTDFIVSDETGEYTFLNNWDINASFDEKAYKCGINKTQGGIELCFGISKYGRRRYAIEYVVHDFIKSYTDSDGTDFMLINPNMSTFPTDAKIDIVLSTGEELSGQNAKIWAFGYNGQIEFSNGHIIAYTTSSLKNDNCMIVMLELDKGVTEPGAHIDKSFETVKDKAMRGSDYDSGNSLWEIVLIAVIILAVLGIVIFLIVSAVKRRLEIKKFYKNAPYYRDIPNGGDMRISHFLANRFDITNEKSLIIGATLLSMINSGSLYCEEEKTAGFFGKEKVSVKLRLLKEPENSTEKELYEIVKSAAGDDGILGEKELEKYSYKNPSRIESFVNNSLNGGEAELISKKCFKKIEGKRIKDLTDKGKEELNEVMGLKKYLEDFSLIAERGISETEIWQEYLVYATLFSIADKAIEQFKKVYPENTVQINEFNRNVILVHGYSHCMYSSYQKAIGEQRSSGFGGSASIGGGGGFSGGGVGGGSR